MKNVDKNQKAPFPPMVRELHVPMQTRRRDHCWKWLSSCYMAALYWNKMIAARKGSDARNKWLQTSIKITNHIVFNRYQSNLVQSCICE